MKPGHWRGALLHVPVAEQAARQIFPDPRRSDRIMKWGTTSTSAQLAGNFAGALEDVSIGDCRLVHLLAEKRSQSVRGLLQYSSQEQTLPVLSLEQ
jgi:hypothetical protein